MTEQDLSLGRFYAGLTLRILALICIILTATWVSDQVKQALGFDMLPHNETAMHKTIMLGLIVYVLLTALPFVPGAEIGMTMLSLFGAALAPLIYGATVMSLVLAFCAGRLIPPTRFAGLLRRLRLMRAAELIDTVTNTDPQERTQKLIDMAGKPALQRLARNRYLALMVLINVPGNVLIGGGGGLAFAAGMSRVFHPGVFLLAVMVAVAPVPLSILLFGL